MPPRGYLIDTNLLLLFVVGSESRDLIAKHRRLKGYSTEDYNSLRQIIDPVGHVLLTPNTLTETSNLIRQHALPERSTLLDRLRSVIEGSEELTVDSIAAVKGKDFENLGLTDAVLLELASEDTPLVTVDLGLYIAVLLKAGESSVIRFLSRQAL